MRIAILSDIHGNLEALEAVCEDLRQAEVDRVICLGDLVGYGPDPELVVTRIRELGCLAILGNHEAALANTRSRKRMNFQARENNISTEALLTAASRDYCCELPTNISIDEALFVHGCPPDSVNCYLYSMDDEDVVKLLQNDAHSLFFVGHTHELKVVFIKEEKVVREKPSLGENRLLRERKYLVNCGSVGQPRDGDPRAKYLIWDSTAWMIDVRAVSYDVETTVEKIVARGFPVSFAQRLK